MGYMHRLPLFGLEKDKSLFVNEAGDWTAGYVPAHIRRYPFILGQTGEKNRYSVMIDRAAPHFSADAGEPLFVDGEPVPGGVVIRARKVLAQFQKELEQTEHFLAPLLEHDVLTERRFAVRRDGKQTIAVEGFRQVDDKKVTALADSVLASWVRSGLMAAVIAHLQSLHNAQRMAQR
jgi:hypothetical protein